MKFLLRNWSIAVSVLAVLATLVLPSTPLLAHDGHRKKSEAEVEQPAADYEPVSANNEPAMEAPEYESMTETSPHTMSASPDGVSAEVSQASETSTEERSTLANATGRINLGLGELTFAVLMTGPFLLKFIKRQLRK